VSQRNGLTDLFFHEDWQGSTRYLTDATGLNAPTAYRHDAYGMQIASSGPDSTALKWAGQHQYQADLPLGLSHVGARQYDSFTGRFLNRDPIGFAGGFNLYGYCENDPVNKVDPEGTVPLDKVVAPFVRYLRGGLMPPPHHLNLDAVEGVARRFGLSLGREVEVPPNPALQRLWAHARNSAKRKGVPCPKPGAGAAEEEGAAPQPAEGGAGARGGGGSRLGRSVVDALGRDLDQRVKAAFKDPALLQQLTWDERMRAAAQYERGCDSDSGQRVGFRHTG
jgi:RHS repeat-associated protein